MGVLLLLLIPLALVFGAIFMAMGMLLFVKPKGIRPPWWDWGMDKPDFVKVEKVEEASVAEVEKPALVKPEVEPKTAPKAPRW